MIALELIAKDPVDGEVRSKIFSLLQSLLFPLGEAFDFAVGSTSEDTMTDLFILTVVSY